MKTLDPKAEYLVKNGKPTAVILPIAEYEELMEDLLRGLFEVFQQNFCFQ